jgi:hypothetical protein
MAKGEFKTAIVAMCIVACAVVFTGCAKKTERGTVIGDVTLDGQPLKSGVIHFESADGKAATADAMIVDGKYTVDMPPGDKRISISAPKVTGKRKAYDTPDSPMVDIVQELLPARYNAQSDLTLTVTAGPQQKDYDLKSGK